jgi:hypothetical protein
MHVLLQPFSLSDEELKFQVNNRRSFEEFVGLGMMNSIADAATVAFFRERLTGVPGSGVNPLAPHAGLASLGGRTSGD